MLALISVLLLALFASWLTGWLLLRFERLHAGLSHDHAASGPQKFHSLPTPRIGGVAIGMGLLAGLGWAQASGQIGGGFVAAVLISLLPAFASGLLEDLTKKLGPDLRLWASFLSALFAIAFFDAVVGRSDLPGVDNLLAWYPIALIFTVVAVGGVAHAVNIVDGYNGLAGVVTVMMLAALGAVSWQVGDTELVMLCGALAGGTLGFLYWNFPRGRIFAGDGGAYLWGVATALVAVLLAHRHAEVSPWFPAVVLLYPVFETAFSIYRRKLKHAAPADQPDARHLHQLIYRRLLASRGARSASPESQALRNAATSPFLWALAALAIAPATLFWRDTGALIALAATFCLVYVWLYRAIVRMTVPRLLRRVGRRASRWALEAGAGQAAEHQDPEGRPVLVRHGERHAE
jgi:UDP-GlcNAc:undecaprenyl-phosphate/decaprenyl-phosphate GlcNAc-1-phosphate transferase